VRFQLLIENRKESSAHVKNATLTGGSEETIQIRILTDSLARPPERHWNRNREVFSLHQHGKV